MKKINIYVAAYIVLFISTAFLFSFGNACSQSSWTRLEYGYNVGSLPPPYQYHYKISITNAGMAELEYTVGYTKTGNNTYKYEVEIGEYNMRNLKTEITNSNILNIKIGQLSNDEIPDGGHSDYVKIFNEDELIASSPLYPKSKYEKILDNLYKVIIKCIPDEIWNEIESHKVKNNYD